MASVEEIRTLATKLKAAGVASSIMDAMEKAKDILNNSEKTLKDMENYNKQVDDDERDLKRIDNDIQQIDTEITNDDQIINKELADIEELDEEIEKEDQTINSITIEAPKPQEVESKQQIQETLFEGKTLNELYAESSPDNPIIPQNQEPAEDIEGANNFDQIEVPTPIDNTEINEDIEGANNLDEVEIPAPIDNTEINEDIEGANNLTENSVERYSSDDTSEHVPEENITVLHSKNTQKLREDMDDLVEDGEIEEQRD